MNGVAIGFLQEALHAIDGCLDIVVGRELRRSPRKPSNVRSNDGLYLVWDASETRECETVGLSSPP
jgi:hypothetical protein